MRTFIVCTILVFCWNDFWDFILKNPTVISGLLGVLIGGTITLYVTGRFYKKKRKDDVSFKLVDQFFEKSNEIAEVNGLLAFGSTYDDIELNRITKLGNWYNFVRGLENKKMISDEILGNMPLGNEIKAFESYIAKKIETPEFTNMSKGWKFLSCNRKALVVDNSGQKK